MLRTFRRLLSLAGRAKKYIYLGIVFNFFKSLSMAAALLAVFIVVENLGQLTAEIIRRALYILLASVAGRFFFQWLCDISMSARGYDMFRD